MIRRITLENYMSHARTVIEPADGLTVLVGPNNCGKSAVVSALQTVCGQHAGDFMVRHGQKVCRITIELPESMSLKDKRGPLKSIITRVRSTFNAAVAEVDEQDSWQIGVLGITVVSSEQRHANQMLDKIVAFIEDNLSEGAMADIEMEFLWPSIA